MNLLFVGVLLVLMAPVLGQHDDEAELREAVIIARQDASALALAGKRRDAAELLESVFPYLRGDEPELAAQIASQIANLHSAMDNKEAAATWYGRAVEARLDDPLAPASRIVWDAMLHSQTHESNGNLEQAAAAMRVAADAVEAAPEHVRPYTAYQVWFQLAQQYTELGRAEEAGAAFRNAEPYLEKAQPDATSEQVMLRVYAIEEGGEFADDERAKMEALVEVYEDERFRDVPHRLSLVGRLAGFYAYYQKEYDTVERLSIDIFNEAVRFEAMFGRQAILDANVDIAYLQSALQLSDSYRNQGRHLEAAEVLEHALFAFPDSQMAQNVERRLMSTYERLGIDPKRVPSWRLPEEPNVDVVTAPLPTPADHGIDVDPARNATDHPSHPGNASAANASESSPGQSTERGLGFAPLLGLAGVGLLAVLGALIALRRSGS